MKVAHVFITMPVGGAEDLVLSILRHSSEEQSAQAVCIRELGVAGECAARDGMPVTLLPLLKGKGKRFSLAAVWKLSRWLKKEDIDVVHTQVYNAHVYGVLAAWLAGVPAVMHHQKTFNRERRRRWWTMRMLSKIAARQVTLSEQTRHDVIKALAVPLNKTTVLPNFVDDSIYSPAQDRAALRRSLGLPVDAPLIGGIASLNIQKNHSATVRMMQALQKRLPEVHGIIFGEGPLREELQAQIDSLGIAGALKLAGNKRPIVPWLQALDVMVLPSSWEGQPMVILQALACHVPVVCSRIEGNTAVLGEDDPGMFDLDDDAAYVDRVHSCLTTPAFRQALIESQGNVQAAQPGFPSFLNQLATIYQLTTADRSPTPPPTPCPHI